MHNEKSEYWEELGDDFNNLKYTATYINNMFSLGTKHFGLNMIPDRKPVVHKSIGSYYSIPSLIGTGHTYPAESVISNVWMDHYFGPYRETPDWDWVSLKLDCGLNIMAGDFKDYRTVMIECKGNLLESDFILESKHLFFHALSMHLLMQPTVEEKIFYPKFGMPYSEQPFEVLSKGGMIGYGIRERTYRSKDNG